MATYQELTEQINQAAAANRDRVRPSFEKRAREIAMYFFVKATEQELDFEYSRRALNGVIQYTLLFGDFTIVVWNNRGGYSAWEIKKKRARTSTSDSFNPITTMPASSIYLAILEKS